MASKPEKERIILCLNCDAVQDKEDWDDAEGKCPHCGSEHGEYYEETGDYYAPPEE